MLRAREMVRESDAHDARFRCESPRQVAGLRVEVRYKSAGRRLPRGCSFPVQFESRGQISLGGETYIHRLGFDHTAPHEKCARWEGDGHRNLRDDHGCPKRAEAQASAACREL